MIVHPQFTSARRIEVLAHLRLVAGNERLCPAVLENLIHETSAELRRLDDIEGWTRGTRETDEAPAPDNVVIFTRAQYQQCR